MSNEILLTWIGQNDLDAASGREKQSGAICQAVENRRFDLVHLLCNYPEEDGRAYCEWLSKRTGSKVEVQHVPTSDMDDPRDFAAIYRAARIAISSVGKKFRNPRLVYHTTSGTPSMYAVWIILAKTSHPAELIQTSPQKGLETVSFPFDLAADYLPDVLLKSDEDICALTQGLPPEASEFRDIIHRCPLMKRVIGEARRIAQHDVPVLIQGETGTGKELFARAIHADSRRRGKPFVALNCAAMPESLIESELFGHERGAFTGANQQRKGRFERAEGGTLFLDEVGEISLPIQVRLLRVLQEKEFERVGGAKLIRTDVRIIAATNRNLLDDIQRGRFREDMFYRLAVTILHLPPLRERQGDVSLLVDYLLGLINRESVFKEAGAKKLSAGARNLILQHSWPGNVRELMHTIHRAAIWTPGRTIRCEDMSAMLLPYGRKTSDTEGILNRPLGGDFSLEEVLNQVAKHYLQRALSGAGGNKTRAARLVGIRSRQNLDNWIKKLEIPLH